MKKLRVVTFVAGVGDISTDLLSPGGDAHSDQIESYMVNVCLSTTKRQQNELLAFTKEHPR